ncbi:MAG: hypothetical protein COA65_08710 [Rhodospirillaceae bacterium]|nr:MAG: hypothetical protein COA65_08710 [Rhodospirillaceae bacterium]
MFEKDGVGYEPYNSEHSREGYKDRPQGSLEYLKWLFKRVKCIKLQMEFVPEKDLKEILSSDYPKILLYREDVKQQYLSEKRASLTGQWHLFKGEKKECDVVYDESEYQKYKDKVDKIYHLARSQIKNYMELEYLDLMNDEKLQRVFDYFGIKIKIKRITKKINV